MSNTAVPDSDCCSPGCNPTPGWGNFSSALTDHRAARAIKCSSVPRGPGQNGICPQPTYLSSPSSRGGNSSQAYLLGQLQQLNQCGGFVQSTGTISAYSALQIPVPQPCSLVATQQGKYTTSASRFQMYNRRQNPVVCPGPTTAELNSTMPQAQVLNYCFNQPNIVQ
jgi:hypothetical protein